MFSIGNPGEPEVPARSIPAAALTEGSAVWDSRDRLFYFVAEPAATAASGTGWIAVRYVDGNVETYPPRTRLQVAIDPTAAAAFNEHRTQETAA